MSFELRYHMFTGPEICEAVVGFMNSKIGATLTNAQPKIERITDTSVVISYQKNEFGARDKEVVPTAELIDALIKWCRSKGIHLPLGGSRSFQALGSILCLRVATNIRASHIPAVEKLILKGAAEP